MQSQTGNASGSPMLKWLFIIGALAAIATCFVYVVVPMIESHKNHAKVPIVVTRNAIQGIETAVQTYEIQMKQLPDSLDDLTVDTEACPALLSKSRLIDAWGTPYVYTKYTSSFKIISAGPDKKIGTPDDISNYDFF